MQEGKGNKQENAEVGKARRSGPVCVEEGSDGVYSAYAGGDGDGDDVRLLGFRGDDAGGVGFGELRGCREGVEDALEMAGEDGCAEGAGTFMDEGRSGGGGKRREGEEGGCRCR